MKSLCFASLLLALPAQGDVLIDSTLGNGGFTSATTGFNGSPASWSAASGVWIDSGNSPLTSTPFGPDSAANSRFIQIHKDSGETLTSTVRFTVAAGDTVALSFDYKTGGSGASPDLTVTLWDSAANATFATLGTISTATSQPSFVQRDFSVVAPAANTNLQLRFTLAAPGGQGKDVHIDRVHLAGGVLTPPDPPQPVEYAQVQHLLPGDSDEVIAEKAAKTLPHPRQVDWQRMENTFFIHYGPNAFTGKEWGTGTESPSVFNPTALDASQWVNEIADAGGKMVMLVVKHHDGFCLWPSRYTAQDVASSPWLGGNGDLARLVSDACAARSIKFGIYLSPADLYQIESSQGYYGDGSATVSSTIPTDPASFSSNPSQGRTPPAGKPALTYTVDAYNRYFLNQLYELLTEYGAISEVWFDGANPKQTNPPQTYDRPAWYDLIRTLQPNAIIAIKGPDARWVGNESGTARESEWSPLPIPVAPENHSWGDMTATDLGSRSKLTRGSYLTWYPAETDVPVLHGWFWAPSKSARTASELINIYYTSVGRNSNLLLNLSPDNRGLIPTKQLAPLRAMSQVIGQTFATDLASGATVSADGSHAEHPASLIRDESLDTWWEPQAGTSTGEIVLTLAGSKTFDVVSLQEAIAQRGQRVESFAIDTWTGSAWSQQATATVIGHKRLIRLASPQTTDRVRIRILQARMEPSLARISLHKQADMVAEPTIARNTAGQVTLTAGVGETIRYTLDGSDPDAADALYTGPFDLVTGGQVRAVAWRAGGSHSLPATMSFGLASAAWSATASAAHAGHPAAHAIDGNPATYWAAAAGAQRTLTLDLGAARWLGGLTYLPRQDGATAGIVKDYRIETSADGIAWTTAAEGSFDNIRNNPVEQTVPFATARQARWVRFVALADVDGGTAANAAEISLLPGGFAAWKTETGYQLVPDADDPDGDGRSLWEEYVFGGSPTRPDRPTAIQTAWAGMPTGLVLSFVLRAAAPDVALTLRAAGELSGPWLPVAADFQIVGESSGLASATFKEIAPPNDPRRFYRVEFQRAGSE